MMRAERFIDWIAYDVDFVPVRRIRWRQADLRLQSCMGSQPRDFSLAKLTVLKYAASLSSLVPVCDVAALFVAMDPLSVTASILAVVTAAAAVLKTLQSIKERKGSSPELSAIINTVILSVSISMSSVTDIDCVGHRFASNFSQCTVFRGSTKR